VNKLSLIIPVFNSAEFLEKNLNSLLDDLGPKLEIILIDDGSTDASFDICQNYSQIQLLRFETNQGVGIVRNAGLEKASGEFIAFLDSDDCLEAGALQSLLRFIESAPNADTIVCRFQLQYSEQPPKDLNKFDIDILNNGSVDQKVEHIWKTQVSEGHFGQCWNFIVRKQFIRDNGIKFSNTRIYEDQEYVCRLLCNANNIAYFHNRSYYRYMIRGGSLSQCHNLKTSIACVKASASLFRLSKEYLHSPLRQNLIESRALVILSYLGYQMLLLNDDEVKAIAEAFESEGKPFEYITLSEQGLPMINAMQAQGCVKGLATYIKKMEEGILDVISEVDTLYIFGVNTLTKGIVRLCQCNPPIYNRS
jgi:glycosyltransferase involved in cell wall biosynthesis